VAQALRTLAASIAVLLVIGVSQAASGTPAPSIPRPRATLAELVQDVGGRDASPSNPRYGYLRRLDSHLQDVAASRLGGGTTTTATIAARRQGVAISPQGDVSVDVYVSGDVAQAADDLRALGMRVTAVSDRAPQRMVEGLLPANALAQASALGTTHAIVSNLSRVETGSVTSQGDAAIDGPQARGLGPNGAGESVGVISDSINEIGGGIAASQSTGDLPATVDDLLDDPNGEDEGRAMAEIVYDEAPGITHLAFSSGTLGPASKAASIDNLVSDGVTAIADDIEYLTEPYFQDDIIAEAVDRAKANGVAYFASAGNDASQSWEGTYAPVADPSLQSPTTEDFDPGAGVDTVQTVGTIPANGSIYVGLQWAEPWGRATTDLALDVYRIVGGVPIFDFTTDTDNIATGIPLEIATVAAGSSPLTFGIAIRRVAGTGTPFMKYIDFTNNLGTVSIEHATNSGAIAPDAASASGSLAVAASNYSVRTTPELFSSRGPVTHYFDANGNPLSTPDVRQKPNLAGPDGVSTSVPVSGLSTFFGTSAAAPAAAGIAALIRSARPAMPVDEVYAIMTNPANALDCTAAGNPDLDCGVGFELADRAVAQALDPTPPVVIPTVVPPTPDGPNGWYHSPVSVSWSVSDPTSPVVDPSGCDPASLTGDTATTLTCTATSAGGTTSIPLTLKRDSSPPSAPVFAGIAPQSYSSATLPPAAAIGCSSSDPTSGIDTCAITGYGSSLGLHTLTAVATDDAGLSATSTLVYTVAATVSTTPLKPGGTSPKGTTPTGGHQSPSATPLAISQLSLPTGGELATLERLGVPITLHVRKPSTRLVIRLVARVPKASGHGKRFITLGSVTRKAGAGTLHLRVELSRKAKHLLKQFRKAMLKVTVSGASAAARTASLQRSVAILP
jgi:Subtilase family